MRKLKEIQEKLFSEYLKYDKIEREKLALLALERQFKMYVVFARGKEWNRDEEYRNIFNILWEKILKREDISEKLWEMQEQIRPENINKDINENYSIEYSFANIFATNMNSFIDMLLDNIGHEESFAVNNFDVINVYLNEQSNYIDKNGLFDNEKKYQRDDLLQIKDLNNKKVIDDRIESYKNMLGLDEV